MGVASNETTSMASSQIRKKVHVGGRRASSEWKDNWAEEVKGRD